MGNSCGDLSRYSDSPCKIYQCVESIVGLASDSDSPTDTWIIKFLPGTAYEKEPIDQGFMKIFLSARNLEAEDDYLMQLGGLEYEVKIYRDIIRPLLDHKICPNFVKYLGSATDCSYGDISGFLGTSVPQANLDRNIYYMRRGLSDRPSITDPVVPRDIKKIFYKKGENYLYRQARSYLYDFLITEPAGPSPHRTFYDYVASGPRIPELFKMYFQIVVACYALSLSKTSHNDLHAENIFLENYADSQGGNLINYVVNDVYFPLNIKYICRLYDFDRAYSVVVGKNFQLNNWLFIRQSQENKFYPSKDIMKISGWMTFAFKDNPEALKMVRDTVTDGGAHWEELYEMWVVKQNFNLQGKGPPNARTALGPDFYAQFPGPERMLENLAGQMRDLGLFEAPGPVGMEDTYMLSKGMLEDGHLNLSTVEADRNQFKAEKE